METGVSGHAAGCGSRCASGARDGTGADDDRSPRDGTGVWAGYRPSTPHRLLLNGRDHGASANARQGTSQPPGRSLRPRDRQTPALIVSECNGSGDRTDTRTSSGPCQPSGGCCRVRSATENGRKETETGATTDAGTTTYPSPPAAGPERPRHPSNVTRASPDAGPGHRRQRHRKLGVACHTSPFSAYLHAEGKGSETQGGTESAPTRADGDDPVPHLRGSPGDNKHSRPRETGLLPGPSGGGGREGRGVSVAGGRGGGADAVSVNSGVGALPASDGSLTVASTPDNVVNKTVPGRGKGGLPLDDNSSDKKKNDKGSVPVFSLDDTELELELGRSLAAKRLLLTSARRCVREKRFSDTAFVALARSGGLAQLDGFQGTPYHHRLPFRSGSSSHGCSSEGVRVGITSASSSSAPASTAATISGVALCPEGLLLGARGLGSVGHAGDRVAGEATDRSSNSSSSSTVESLSLSLALRGGGAPGAAKPALLKRNSFSLPPISEEEMLDLMERTDMQEVLSCLPPCQCDACLLAGEGDASAAAAAPKAGSGAGVRPLGSRGVPLACNCAVNGNSATQHLTLRRQSSWKKIRNIIRWSPFIQVFKKHRYPWIQLAGHQGNFQAGEAGAVLKKLDSREHLALQKLMNDRLQHYVPEFRGVVEKSGERYVQLQDLLCEFSSPCVMDIKMGVRTYLEEELEKARKKPTMRKDMYQKMVDIDSSAPTPEENALKAVTKPRYMQWRDQMSSSVDLGFRIEGIKKSDGASSKDFKKTKTRDSVAEVLKHFIGDNQAVLTGYLARLREICATQEASEFFQSHEVIGSSLLFVHDAHGNVSVWMIDFGKTEPLPAGLRVNHRDPWVEGNHEDGYLFGLDNIITILEELQEASSTV